MDRPQWSALRGLVDGLQRSMGDLDRARREMLDITGTAWSDDRLIKAVVGPRGQLVELEIDPRIYRTPNSKALSATILATVRTAVDDANTQTSAVMERLLPKDRANGLPGKTDFDALLGSHDADLPTTLRKEEGHGYVS